MPWELGLGDGILGYKNTVTLPLINYFKKDIDKDYLAMYGYIETTESRDRTFEDWAVRYPDGSAV